MNPENDVPETREDLARMKVEFRTLNEAETERHWSFLDELVEYLSLEADADLRAEDLTFLRSAQVGDHRYWIWQFKGTSLEPWYATVSESPNGSICLGCDSAEGLTPEQFMLAGHNNWL